MDEDGVFLNVPYDTKYEPLFAMLVGLIVSLLVYTKRLERLKYWLAFTGELSQGVVWRRLDAEEDSFGGQVDGEDDYAPGDA